MFRLWLEVGLLVGISVAATFLVIRALVLWVVRKIRRLRWKMRERWMKWRRDFWFWRFRRRWGKWYRKHGRTPFDPLPEPQTDEERADLFVQQMKAILAAEAERDREQKNRMRS